jgi:hypothetical protein
MIRLSRGTSVTLRQRLGQFVRLIDRRIPDRLPRLTGTGFKLFRLLWFAAFLLAIIGPIAGLWMRYTAPTVNSQLIAGSRVGFAVSRDVTLVRFTLGSEPQTTGIIPGDHIVAINGLPLPKTMPIWDVVYAAHPNDPAYIAMGDLLLGADSSRVVLKVRDPDGHVRDVTVTPGEQHIDAAAREHHISPKLLSFLDQLPVLAFPILLWIAFSLYTRNPDQPVPSLLSFSILVTIAASQPSAVFVQHLGLPRALDAAFYDLGSVSFLAAVLLFPDARLRPRLILIALGVLPVLFFLDEPSYQLMFLSALVIGLVVFVRRLRAEAGAAGQQLKLLFVGLAGWLVFRSLFVLFGYIRESAVSFSRQLLFEGLAEATFALSTVSLFLWLFSALRRHRLYDADALFSRSAMVALLTLTIAAFFAAASAGLQAAADAVLGESAGPWPTIIAAAAAVLLINPVQALIHRGTTRVFQRDLFKFRTELPKRMDDLRETASAATLLEVALANTVRGLRATRAAAIINGRVVASVGRETRDVRQWIHSTELPCPARLNSRREDELFPVRLPLRSSTDPLLPIGWIVLGPRPDGSLYSPDERQALLHVEESISRAVEVARQRQQAKSDEARWKERQEKRVKALEERLASLVEANGRLKRLPA